MSDSEMKLNGVSRDEKRRWTDAEVRYLSAHRADGSYLIAHVLKRTPLSVRVKAARLHISLDRKPMKVCPICGTYFVRDNKAGRYGMCQVCWERRKDPYPAAHPVLFTRTKLSGRALRNPLRCGRADSVSRPAHLR